MWSFFISAEKLIQALDEKYLTGWLSTVILLFVYLRHNTVEMATSYISGVANSSFCAQIFALTEGLESVILYKKVLPLDGQPSELCQSIMTA